jgi:hypothetical protein
MQMHSLWFDNDENMLPPYQISSSPTMLPVDASFLGANLEAALHGQTNIESPTIVMAGGASTGFHKWNAYPWFYNGVVSSAAGNNADPNATIFNQAYMAFHKKAHIYGKKVRTIERSYDLAKCWSNRWIPIKSHFLPFHNASLNGPGGMRNWNNGRTGTKGELYVNDISIPAGDMNEAVFSQLVVPTGGTVYQQPNNPSLGNTQHGAPAGTNWTLQGWNSTSKHYVGIPNIMLQVEHLPNPDNSIVKILLDCYFDTTISIEVDFDHGVYMADHDTHFGQDGTGNGAFFAFTTPSLFQNKCFGDGNMHTDTRFLVPNVYAPGATQNLTGTEMGYFGAPMIERVVTDIDIP